MGVCVCGGGVMGVGSLSYSADSNQGEGRWHQVNICIAILNIWYVPSWFLHLCCIWCVYVSEYHFGSLVFSISSASATSFISLRKTFTNVLHVALPEEIQDMNISCRQCSGLLGNVSRNCLSLLYLTFRYTPSVNHSDTYFVALSICRRSSSIQYTISNY